VAVAVALPRGARARGLGVDVELDRPVRRGLAGVFCDARERAWLDTLPAADRDGSVLQLWTAKEALFKADAAQGDAIVAEYRVDVPTLTRGGRDAARKSRLFSLRTGDASVSVALDPEDEHVAATW
ncbi:MAG: 4'-phosphopantetheinyl transferase superfamily protein, partial [Deltaproteobacteria bacterium]|nr:4'-phosphopantetheinyl transferase superfamily protein [Kofleriaceae bacterium]